VRMINTLLGLIKQLYPLRNCRHNLSEENIKKKKFKVCLEYHIGNCLGSCVGFQSTNDYEKSIFEIRQILKGNIASIVLPMKKQMDQYAKNYEFEKAQIIKEKLFLLKEYQSKSTVVNPKIENVDVYSIISDEKSGFVNFLKVVNGAIIQAQNFEILKKLDESDEELLIHAIMELRQNFKTNAVEVIVPYVFDFEIPGINFIVPKIGDKRKLLDLSYQNAKFSKIEKQKRLDFVDPDRHSKRILNQMMKDLRLKELPENIECFDNSNMHGDHPVAAMVVFRKAKPSKSEYRHYNIKTVSGPNDFASMEEIVFRRYKRLLDENKALPNLIIVDGGKGQLSSALSSLSRLNLQGKIPIIGIAKRLEEIYFPGDSVPLYIEKKSETLKIIQQLRDEAHRFGITHFRKKLEKHTIKSELTEIKGIGFSTTEKLLKKFKSVKKIKEASFEDLETVIGKSKAKIVYEFLLSDN
jgi:excinuclease ABC subunit C